MARGDLLEQAAINLHQRPETGAGVVINQWDEFFRGGVELARALRFKLKKRREVCGLKSVAQLARAQFLGQELEANEIFFRYIDTAHEGVFFHVANDVGEL